MGVSRAGPRARPAAGGRRLETLPVAVVEFALDQTMNGDPATSTLAAVLERFATAFRGRAALALELETGRPPVVLAAHPPEAAADGELLAQIGARIAERPDVTAAGGCFQTALVPPQPRSERRSRDRDAAPSSVLAACARPASGPAVGRPADPPGDQAPGDQAPGDQAPGDQAPGDQAPGDHAADPAARPPPPGRTAHPAAEQPASAIILIGSDSRHDPEAQATARAIAAILASHRDRAAEGRELAERQAITVALIEASPDAVVVADAERRIVRFNPAAERLIGRRHADVLGKDMGSVLIPARNRGRFMESTERYLRTGDPGQYVGRLNLPVLLADGTERTVELTPLPLMVAGQAYFCNFMRDVTELERANAALATSEVRFRLFSELAPVGMARTDRGGVCTFVNERWCVLGGGSPGDFTGSAWTTVLHPEDAGKVTEDWARAQAEGAELRVDCRIRPSGGDQVWVHAAVAPFAGGGDGPAGFMVALTNISARKRAEREREQVLVAEQAARRELADQTERLNSLIAAAIPGVVVADEHGRVTQLNESFRVMFGISEPVADFEDTLSTDVVRRIKAAFADPAAFAQAMNGLVKGRRPVDGVQFAGADRRTVECDYWPVFVSGCYRGDLWLFWDMTERKATEERQERQLGAELAARRAAEAEKRRLAEQNDRLRAVDELKTQFLATVSHELRGPLTSIVSYAELIRDDAHGLSPESAGFLDVVERSADRLTQLVGDLLLLSRIEAGVIPLEMASVSVAEVITEAVRAASPDAARQGVVLDCSAGEGPPLRADRGRLQQVIGNLITNAVKFTNDGGQVRVAAAYRDGEWRIDVEDSGIGIPAGELGKLFDRFFRASNARTAGRPGSGLGLSVVKAITELHGGHIDVASTLGSGTIFSVYLPARSTGS